MPLSSTPHPQVATPEHLTIRPSVLYFGTPVVLMTTLNPSGAANITPMSSAWALGDRVVLGLGSAGQGAENLLRDGACVLNLPSAALWPQVERIACTTGRDPVPAYKADAGYEHVADKFALGGFTRLASELVQPPRIQECPLQLEAELVGAYGEQAMATAEQGAAHLIVETRVVRVHAHREVVVPGTQHIDTQHWRPLFYVFRHYFGLGDDLGRNFKAET